MKIDTCFERVVFTEQELKELCAEWREVLRLNHWFIDVRIVRQRQFRLENCDGEVVRNLPSSKATIKILAPEDYPDSDFPQDMEIILVHELLHLAFDPFEPEGNLKYDLMEGTIERLATVLVEMKRKYNLTKEKLESLYQRMGDSTK